MYILILLVILLFHLIVALKTSDYAEDKGYNGNNIFWWVLFTGTIGILMVIAMPDLKARENQEKIIELLGGKKEEEKS